MMPWIALLAIALALGATGAVISSRRVRALRDELFEDALPSARTGKAPAPSGQPAGPPIEDPGGGGWGLRWAEVTNLTPAGPDRRREPSRPSTEERAKSSVGS